MSQLGWEQEVDRARSELESMHGSRETALKQCRLLIQTSSKCIRCVHRREFDQAVALVGEAKQIAAATRAALAGHPELYFAGYLQDAEKELVEAAALLEWVRPGGDGSTPSRESLGVGVVAYLNGMGEAASEARRYVLDELRGGRLATAESLLKEMETVYDDLISFDFPDGMTGGLRRTCDALRAVIERTRSDVTMTTVQNELMSELRASHRPSSPN